MQLFILPAGPQRLGTVCEHLKMYRGTFEATFVCEGRRPEDMSAGSSILHQWAVNANVVLQVMGAAAVYPDVYPGIRDGKGEGANRVLMLDARKGRFKVVVYPAYDPLTRPWRAAETHIIFRALELALSQYIASIDNAAPMWTLHSVKTIGAPTL